MSDTYFLSSRINDQTLVDIRPVTSIGRARMGRPLRAVAGDTIYHVLNRSNAGLPMFEKPGDFAAFEQVLGEACKREETRVLAYCVMPNHWHLVLWPKKTGELSRFAAWVTLTHTQRWHVHRQSTGAGHVYQGRFKSFPIQEDDHFLTVCRYVERNALRAGLVTRAEEWRWSSLWRRTHGEVTRSPLLTPWPFEAQSDWVDWVNQPQTPTELEALRSSVQRGQPYGSSTWAEMFARTPPQNRTAKARGRPRKRASEVDFRIAKNGV